MDVLTATQRQRCMASIRGKNTKPELCLRKAIFSLGIRYRLHQTDLPGTPDLVLPKFHAVIFLHGCFWHGHGCRLFVTPATNREFWLTKIARNQSRDKAVLHALREEGWRVLTVWECAFRGPGTATAAEIAQRVKSWLCGRGVTGELP